ISVEVDSLKSSRDVSHALEVSRFTQVASNLGYPLCSRGGPGCFCNLGLGGGISVEVDSLKSSRDVSHALEASRFTQVASNLG
ncbi:MAG TPA: hypothetical protein P5307_12885, partial [Pirellulaceae bacterium]|nr:hypothetical protein [Pirellulaceae bacterium]